jgi:hypothetical protein
MKMRVLAIPMGGEAVRLRSSRFSTIHDPKPPHRRSRIRASVLQTSCAPRYHLRSGNAKCHHRGPTHTPSSHPAAGPSQIMGSRGTSACCGVKASEPIRLRS